jgi:hypothetical protein
MTLWTFLGSMLQSVAVSPATDAKIQIRRPGDRIWRDQSWVSNNPDSIRNGLMSVSSANPDADVRAVDRHGRMLDFE